MWQMSLSNVVACQVLCKPGMRANEIFDSIDSTELTTVTGGSFLAGWFSRPAPALTKTPNHLKHKHSGGVSSNLEVLRPTGWGEGNYGWSQ
jgi:hypothetical protein